MAHRTDRHLKIAHHFPSSCAEVAGIDVVNIRQCVLLGADFVFNRTIFAAPVALQKRIFDPTFARRIDNCSNVLQDGVSKRQQILCDEYIVVTRELVEHLIPFDEDPLQRELLGQADGIVIVWLSTHEVNDVRPPEKNRMNWLSGPSRLNRQQTL